MTEENTSESTETQEDRILEYTKNSLGMSLDDKDAYLKANIKAAMQAVQGRIGSDPDFYVENWLFELAVSELAVSNFMNRSASTDVNLYATEYGFSDYILDLKATYAQTHQNGGDSDGTT